MADKRGRDLDDDIQYDEADLEEEDDEDEPARRKARVLHHHQEDSSSGEDLFGQQLERDYEARPELDVYDAAELDEAQYEQSLVARRKAEEEMLKRDREVRRGQIADGELPAGLLSSSEDEQDEEEFKRRRGLRRLGFDIDEEDQDDLDEEDQEYAVNLGSDLKGPLKDYLQLDAPRRAISRKFRDFLTTFKDDNGNPVYQNRIKAMCAENRESLEISFMHLSQASPILAIWVIDAPKEMLLIFDEVARRATRSLFRAYDAIHAQIHARITNLPMLDTLRGLRHTHLDGLITVRGVVTRRTSVIPELAVVYYNCSRCGSGVGPIFVLSGSGPPRISCSNTDCRSRHFDVDTNKTLYRNFQKITLQESPGSVPAGRLPRTKDIHLMWDLVDSCRPGEEIEVTGIYCHSFDAWLNKKQGFPVFSTTIEANYIGKKEDSYAGFRLTEEDEREIRALSQDPNIADRIFRSMAPSIYGHEDIKTAIALVLFGGVQKTKKGGHRIRGDLNCLLLGDPGTAKSQFLKYIEKTANRAVFTTGQGASAVGLTASVQKDPITREWTLSGGAMVLADQGICLIDEFEKMNDHDRTSILEAMEQQSISVSKAGIVTTLQARCTVCAAANPVKGRYDSSRSFRQNVDLSEPLLSRFDILIVVRDTVSPIVDEQLSRFVVNSHIRSHPSNRGVDGQAVFEDAEESDLIPQELLRKYLIYAKTKCRPRVTDINSEKISSLYAEMRHASKSGGMVMTLRHVESMVRMAEAHARIHLRDFVSGEDVNVAIRVMLDSFISCQKFSIARQMRTQFRKYITFRRDPNDLLLYLLRNLTREVINFAVLQSQSAGVEYSMEDVEIDCDDFEARARELDINDVSGFYMANIFLNEGFVIDRRRNLIIKTVQKA